MKLVRVIFMRELEWLCVLITSVQTPDLCPLKLCEFKHIPGISQSMRVRNLDISQAGDNYQNVKSQKTDLVWFLISITV